MIDKINANCPHLVVVSTNTAWIHNNGESAGITRFNTSSQQLEAYDGHIWRSISNTVDAHLSNRATEAITWAMIKMQEEKDLVKKMEQYPMLKSAFEQFKIVEALVHEDNISGS